jgi:hypothetical protein
MTAVTLRVLEMLVRVLAWIGAHPSDDAGFQVLVTRLQSVVTRMTQVVDVQRGGRVDSRAARVRKRELRQAMMDGPIELLSRIGALVSGDHPQLRVAFAFRPTANSLLAFQRAARAMFEQAQASVEVLVQHGLSASALTQFGQWLDEFDRMMALGADGRARHTAATRELDALTKEGLAIIRAMDASLRLRYAEDRQVLEQWISTRTVLGTPVEKAKAGDGTTEGGTPAAGGDVRPAA